VHHAAQEPDQPGGILDATPGKNFFLLLPETVGMLGPRDDTYARVGARLHRNGCGRETYLWEGLRAEVFTPSVRYLAAIIHHLVEHAISKFKNRM
jgi:hypothetical protein